MTDGITAVSPFDPDGGGQLIAPEGTIAYATIEGDEDHVFALAVPENPAPCTSTIASPAPTS